MSTCSHVFHGNNCIYNLVLSVCPDAPWRGWEFTVCHKWSGSGLPHPCRLSVHLFHQWSREKCGSLHLWMWIVSPCTSAGFGFVHLGAHRSGGCTFGGLLILIAFVLQHYEVTYFVPGSRSCSEVSFDISITTPAFFWLVLWQWFLIISYYIFLFSKHPLLFFVMEMALGFPWGYTLSLLKVKMSFFKNELSYGHYLHAIKFNTGRHKNLIT